MPIPIPPNDARLLEVIDGKFTGRIDARWRRYLIDRDARESLLTPDLSTDRGGQLGQLEELAHLLGSQAIPPRDGSPIGIMEPPATPFDVKDALLSLEPSPQPPFDVKESILSAIPDSRRWSEFQFIADTAANLASYPAAAFSSAIYFETDTFVTRYTNGAAWVEFIFPALVKLLGSTNAFPALKRSAAILQARLADDSAYTDLEVLDEAYDATTWNGSNEVPTKNAIRDKIVALFPTDPPSSTYTPTLTKVANLDAVTAYDLTYYRVGNTVTVSGKADVDSTAVGAISILGISLPIASNFGAVNQLGGAGAAGATGGEAASIEADAANDRAQMYWIANTLNNQPLTFSFTYRVI